MIVFSDAFLTLFMKEEDREVGVLFFNGEFYVHTRIFFGMASAPLLWGRGAAAAGRLG